MTLVAQMRTELRYLVRELGLMNRNCLNSGMTLNQAHIMTYIEKNGPTSFLELQTHLGMDKASLSRALKTLREKMFLQINALSTDRRVRFIEILPKGISALRKAEELANETFDSILTGFDKNNWDNTCEAIKHLRIATLRNNLARVPQRIQIELLRDRYSDQLLALITKIFSGEQNIPENLVPIPASIQAKWWGIRIGEEIIGVAAAWQEDGQWHWGRFAVDANFRGLGLGKKLASESIAALFAHSVEVIMVNARDITVDILKKMGGKQTGPSVDFFGEPVTSMSIAKNDFIPDS